MNNPCQARCSEVDCIRTWLAVERPGKPRHRAERPLGTCTGDCFLRGVGHAAATWYEDVIAVIENVASASTPLALTDTLCRMACLPELAPFLNRERLRNALCSLVNDQNMDEAVVGFCCWVLVQIGGDDCIIRAIEGRRMPEAWIYPCAGRLFTIDVPFARRLVRHFFAPAAGCGKGSAAQSLEIANRLAEHIDLAGLQEILFRFDRRRRPVDDPTNADLCDTAMFREPASPFRIVRLFEQEAQQYLLMTRGEYYRALGSAQSPDSLDGEIVKSVPHDRRYIDITDPFTTVASNNLHLVRSCADKSLQEAYAVFSKKAGRDNVVPLFPRRAPDPEPSPDAPLE